MVSMYSTLMYGQYVQYTNVWSVCPNNVLNLLDYLIMPYPTFLVTVLLGSIILTFSSIFVTVFIVAKVLNILRKSI